MPIRPDLRHFYNTPEWEAAKQRALARAGKKCLFCRKPHKQKVLVTRDGTGRWNQAATDYITRRALEQFENAKPSWLWDEWALEIGCPARAMHAWHNAEHKFPKIAPLPEKGRVYLINRSLTTAHLDHNPANLEDSNIVSLCEHCHLKADAHHHFANARRSVAAQVGQAWLSPEIEGAAEITQA
jgi:hypothetical protein